MNLRTSRATAKNPRGLSRKSNRMQSLAFLTFSCNWGVTTNFHLWVELLSGQYSSPVTLLRRFFWDAVSTRWICRRPYRHGAADASRRLTRAFSRSCRPTRERRERLPAADRNSCPSLSVYAFSRMCLKIGQNASTQSARVTTAYSRPPVSLHRQIRRKTSTGTLIRNLASENARRHSRTRPATHEDHRKARDAPCRLSPRRLNPANSNHRSAQPKLMALIGPVPVMIESNCGSFASYA